MATKDSDKTKAEPLKDKTDTLEEPKEIVSDDDFGEATFDDDEHEDDPAALSVRILRVLAILLMGAIGALWAGPKLAPMLPAGLKPVAEFLAPQANMNAKITGLRAELEDRIAKAETASNKTDVLAQITPELDALKTKNTELATSLASFSQSAKALKVSLTELQLEVSNITAHQAMTSQSGQVSEQALKRLETKLAAITAAQQKLNDSQSMAVEAQQDAEGKLRMASATATLAKISGALKIGGSFQTALDDFANISTLTPPTALTAISSSGTPPLAILKKQFPELARTALRNDTAANNGGSTVAKLTSFLKSQIGTRSLDPQLGDSLDAVLSRIEAGLEQANLQAALTETALLSAAAKQTMGPWITSLAQLNNALRAVQTLQHKLATGKN